MRYTEEWAIDALDRFLHGDFEGAKVVLSYGVKMYQTLDEKSPTT